MMYRPTYPAAKPSMPQTAKRQRPTMSRADRRVMKYRLYASVRAPIFFLASKSFGPYAAATVVRAIVRMNHFLYGTRKL